MPSLNDCGQFDQNGGVQATGELQGTQVEVCFDVRMAEWGKEELGEAATGWVKSIQPFL